MIDCDVVIIDSGLKQNNSVISGICIEKSGERFRFSSDFEDEIGHGTIIYSLINKHVEANKIYIVKLSNHSDDFDDSFLVAALEYILQNVRCKVINVSLGVKVSANIQKFHHICQEITAKGSVIVSAFDNEGCYSYPAAFDCVIGVDSKMDFKLASEFDFVENSPVNVLAKGSLQRVTMPKGKIVLVDGTSIACAHITSILANALASHFDLQSALAYLKSNARQIYSSSVSENDNSNQLFEISRAVVFPFAKEAHAFVRFSDMLPFQIKGYYDIRSSGKVGRKLATYCKEIKSEECIMDIEKINWSEINTIILGHLDELNKIVGRDYRRELIKRAISTKVNVYSFDPLEPYEDLLRDSPIAYFYPRVRRYNVPQNSFGKLYKIDKPVVGIFGTSSQQGKFSLQLTLKRELELCGYDVGTIGTEPHSLLFNFDAVFPMGYNSTVELNDHEIVLYLNNEIHKLCQMGKEIILTSTQAQIVPYYCNNLLEFPVMQFPFTLGTKPDAIIMCVNYHDEIPYIRNSMYALMGLTDATIIAIVIYPIAYFNMENGAYNECKRGITDNEFQEKADILQKEFLIPVYMLGEQQHMSSLCQMIVDYF